MKTRLFLLCAALFCVSLSAAARRGDGYISLKDLSYAGVERVDGFAESPEQLAYKAERCKLDLYYPKDVKGFATLVWYHGGGLAGGEKHLMEEFMNQGFAVVSVNYRLYPRAHCPDYLYDSAQALAWTFRNIEKYGGDPGQIYVSGHSAGGYLTFMLVLAKEYCQAYGLDADRIAKAYPISGQTFTHFTIKKERGLDFDLPVIDSYAPANKVRREGAPLMIITGDRNREMLARWEENAEIAAILKRFSHPYEFFELQGFDHGNVVIPAAVLIREDIKKNWKAARKASE